MELMNNSCDVLVVGAGVAGVADALASARNGVKTVLAEKENFLGGVGYAGLHQYMCGLYLNGDVMPTETLNAGIVREIVGLLNKFSPQKTIKKIGQVYVLPYSREDLAKVFTSLCRNEKNLTVLFNATAVSVKKKNRTIVEVALNTPVSKTIPKILIDCTGSGVVSAMAGASFELSPPEKLQLSGYTIYLKGLKEQDETLSIKVPYYLAEAAKKKILPPYLRFSTFSP